MPLYEYRCTRCDHRFEVYHEVGGTPGACPVCGGSARRVFSSVGLIFRGSGFHTTDYRKAAPSDGKDGKDKGQTTSAPTPESPSTPAKPST